MCHHEHFSSNLSTWRRSHNITFCRICNITWWRHVLSLYRYNHLCSITNSIFLSLFIGCSTTMYFIVSIEVLHQNERPWELLYKVINFWLSNMVIWENIKGAYNNFFYVGLLIKQFPVNFIWLYSILLYYYRRVTRSCIILVAWNVIFKFIALFYFDKTFL